MEYPVKTLNINPKIYSGCFYHYFFTYLEGILVKDPAPNVMHQRVSLRDGAYALVAAGMDKEAVEHPGFEGLSINLKALW